MVAVVIVGLILLVVHAANKVAVTATATVAAGGDPTPLPPPSPVAVTGATSAPSPATWGGAPGSASNYAIKLNTNSPNVNADSIGLTSAGDPNTPGVPVALVGAGQFNGFDSVPAQTKQLSVNQRPARVGVAKYGGWGGNKL